MTANAELADRLRAQADAAMARRRVLLTVSAALAETTTIAGARKVLAMLDDLGQADLHAAALAILDKLTQDVPASQGGAAPKETP